MSLAHGGRTHVGDAVAIEEPARDENIYSPCALDGTILTVTANGKATVRELKQRACNLLPTPFFTLVPPSGTLWNHISF